MTMELKTTAVHRAKLRQWANIRVNHFSTRGIRGEMILNLLSDLETTTAELNRTKERLAHYEAKDGARTIAEPVKDVPAEVGRVRVFINKKEEPGVADCFWLFRNGIKKGEYWHSGTYYEPAWEGTESYAASCRELTPAEVSAFLVKHPQAAKLYQESPHE